MNCHSLDNSTVGIVGCGAIGSCLAKKLLKAFNLKQLLYYSRMEKPESNLWRRKYVIRARFLRMLSNEVLKKVPKRKVASYIFGTFARPISGGRGGLTPKINVTILSQILH